MTSDASIEFLVPDGVTLAEAEARLAAHLRLEARAAESVDRTFYDTVDGRLHAGGLWLARANGRLSALDASGEIAGAPANGRPCRLLVADLPAGGLHDLLAPIVEMRALAPIARIRSRRRLLRVLDGEAKTVVRILLEEPEVVVHGRSAVRLESRLRLEGVRGYDAALARVSRSLEQELGFARATRPLLDSAVSAAGGIPGGVSSKLDVALRPDQRADSAATALLVRLFGTIEQNRPGVLDDTDSEYLHDLRVAVRRTRSAQRQLRQIFPSEPLAWFRGEFRWLQQATGPTRDLDVHLWEFEELRSTLPEGQRADLEPLRTLLAALRRREQKRMVRALRSSRFEALLRDWPLFLEGLVGAPLDDRPDAARPIASFSGERIGVVYRRMVKAGGAIDEASPPEALHDLRKAGKELRYLLELFASVHPPDVVNPMIRTLKALQDALGRFYDREVQANQLRSLRSEVAVLDDGPAALMAMGLLVARLEADQAAARSEFADRFAAFAATRQRALVRRTFV